MRRTPPTCGRAILAVVSLAAELVIAAPIAAFMHIRADGQELINQEQRTIYTMTFNALLRPSLLLCGLVVANLTFSVMANFLNKLYGPAVAAVNGDTVIGVIGLIVLTVLIFYLHYQLVVRSMQLISAVAAAVSDIIGAKDQDRGEHNESNKVFAAVGNISARTGQGASASLTAGLKAAHDDRKKAATEGAPGSGGGENAVKQATAGPSGKGN